MVDLTTWTGVKPPARAVMEGRYTRLEPLDASRHSDGLFAAAVADGAETRFRYLFDDPPKSIEEQVIWTEKAALSHDPLFFAVVDKSTGRTGGRQAFMRIDPIHGVIEVGSVLWGPSIARTCVATEALFLFADHVFAQGYRRFEWKCNADNVPSRQAALRFGFTFEGIFRHHMVVKGQNRDTAWFSMLDLEWPRLRAGFDRWLAPENFDEEGRQKSRLHFD